MSSKKVDYENEEKWLQYRTCLFENKGNKTKSAAEADIPLATVNYHHEKPEFRAWLEQEEMQTISAAASVSRKALTDAVMKRKPMKAEDRAVHKLVIDTEERMKKSIGRDNSLDAPVANLSLDVINDLIEWKVEKRAKELLEARKN